MKILFTLLFSIVAFCAVAATPGDKIRISTTGKNASIELSYKSVSQNSLATIITITNDAGNVVATKNAALAFGENTISVCDVAGLKEGQYTVKMTTGKKTMTTQFVIWK